MNMTGYVLFWNLLGVKLPWGYSHKTRSWCLLGVTFKKSDEHPCHFYMGVSPWDPIFPHAPARCNCHFFSALISGRLRGTRQIQYPPHAVQHGAIRPQPDHLISVSYVMSESIFDAWEVRVWHPNKLEHFRIEGESLSVPGTVVLKTLIFPVLTKVHYCSKLLLHVRNA